MEYESGSIAEELINEGIEKGIEKGIVQVALKMIDAGKTDFEISDLTGLPLNTIAELRGGER